MTYCRTHVITVCGAILRFAVLNLFHDCIIQIQNTHSHLWHQCSIAVTSQGGKGTGIISVTVVVSQNLEIRRQVCRLRSH